MLRKIATFRSDSAFSTWLHRIAVNTVQMHFRKKSLNQVSLEEPYNDGDGAHIRRAGIPANLMFHGISNSTKLRMLSFW